MVGTVGAGLAPARIPLMGWDGRGGSGTRPRTPTPARVPPPPARCIRRPAYPFHMVREEKIMGTNQHAQGRKSKRAKFHNYSWSGSYLITIVAKDRTRFFDIPELRTILETTWKELPGRFPNVTLDEFVIMPDHVHFVIHIRGNDAQPVSLYSVVGAYKSLVVHYWLLQLKKMGTAGMVYTAKIWERSYDDRIIFNHQELEQKRRYVHNNPLKPPKLGYGKDD
jgi:putative transposase